MKHLMALYLTDMKNEWILRIRMYWRGVKNYVEEIIKDYCSSLICLNDYGEHTFGGGSCS